jgi:hypothetical protein
MKTIDEAIEYYQEKVENYTYLVKWLIKLKKIENKNMDEENIYQLLYKIVDDTYEYDEDEYDEESELKFPPPRRAPLG